MVHPQRSRLRDRARPIWRGYLRLPRPIRWPLTAVVLVLAAVIVVNLTFDPALEVERNFLIPPGELRLLEVQIDPGRNSDVSWTIGARQGEASAFPLRARLTGPGEAQESLSGPGIFRFKGGFTSALYVLELLNQADDANVAVAVRWIVR